MLNRRKILTRIITALPVLTIAGVSLSPLRRRALFQHNLKYDDLVLASPQDWADLYKQNAAVVSAALPLSAGLQAFLTNDSAALIGHLHGSIVELGVHSAVNSQLQAQYGASYMGVDIMPMGGLRGMMMLDVRELADLENKKARFVWNDVGTWQDSPRSRRSALEWAQRNLHVGGIYIDGDAYTIPTDLDYSSFELIIKGPGYTVFQKI